jgi:HEAT repeat protein
MDSAGVERALGAIGTTFRLMRLYPPSHPAVMESMRQIASVLPTLADQGPVEWKVGAIGFHWHGQQLLPRNVHVSELAGLLYTRGIRAVQMNPGATAEHAIGLFAVATGTVQPNEAVLGPIGLSMSRRSQRLLPGILERSPLWSTPTELDAAPPSPAGDPEPPKLEPRPSAPFRFDAVPVDVEVQRAIGEVTSAQGPDAQRAAVENLQRLTPALLGLRDVGMIGGAIGALDRLLATTADSGVAEAIGALAGALAEKATVERMVARLGEPRVPAAERETLVTALGALASLSVEPVLHAYLGAPVDQREPYRAIMRRAGERALEPLQARLADKDEAVLAVAAELTGLTGAPQAVAMLVPLLHHDSEFVREGAVTGLGEIGGREISRPLMPVLKDESVTVRSAAARAIAAAGDVAATTVLIRRLDQEADEGVLADLLRAIGRLGGGREVLDALARHAEPGGMLRRRNATVRAAAVEAIAGLPNREARGLLELYSHDKEPAVRKAAETALR